MTTGTRRHGGTTTSFAAPTAGSSTAPGASAPSVLGDLYTTRKLRQVPGRQVHQAAGSALRRSPWRHSSRLLKSGNGRRLLDFRVRQRLVPRHRPRAWLQVLRRQPGGWSRRRDRSRVGKHVVAAHPMRSRPAGFSVKTMSVAILAQPMEDLSASPPANPDGVLLILTVNAGSLVLKRGWRGAGSRRTTSSSPRHRRLLLLRRAGFHAVPSRPLGTGTRSTLPSVLPRSDSSASNRGNRGNMSAAGPDFADPDGPRHWAPGMRDASVRVRRVAERRRRSSWEEATSPRRSARRLTPPGAEVTASSRPTTRRCARGSGRPEMVCIATRDDAFPLRIALLVRELDADVPLS